MAWEEFKFSGATNKTPKNILLDAGTLFKNFAWDGSAWNGTPFGATSGGTKFSVVPELYDIPIDGVRVKAKGATQKVGETAKFETNMIELTKDWYKATIIGKEGTSEDERFDVIESKENIDDDDYINNFAYVGRMTDGTPTMIIFDYALCTSGLEGEGKNKEASVFPATFECYAELSDVIANKLPYHIYVAKTA